MGVSALQKTANIKDVGRNIDLLNQILVDNFNEMDNFKKIEQHLDNYEPNLFNLQQQLWNQIYGIPNLDTEFYNSLLLESFSIALFTTVSGLSILNSMHAMSKVSAKLKNNLYSDKVTKRISQYWLDNPKLMILRLNYFILKNNNMPINIEKYNNPDYKFALKDWLEFDKEMELSIVTATLNPKYNIILNFIWEFLPILEFLVSKTFPNNILKPLVTSYKRNEQLNDRFVANSYKSNRFLLQENKLFNKKILTELYLKNILEKIPPVDPKKFTKALEQEFDKTSEIDTADQNVVPNLHDNTKKSTKLSKWIKNMNIKNSINDGVLTKMDEDDNNDYSVNNETDMNELITKFRISTRHDLLWQCELRHNILGLLLNLKDVGSTLLVEQFNYMIKLVDPLTQPAPNDKHIISLDLLYNLFLGFIYPDIVKEFGLANDENSWRFNICVNMQKLLTQSMIKLNCYDYDKLVNIRLTCNDSDNDNEWRNHLHEWLPHGLNTQDLELIYMIDIMAVYTIYKLYSNYPIQLNPFLTTIISIWKNLSCTILLGLEIDRLVEETETFVTPILVRATVRGASALRSVIATILNNHMEYNEHDFKHEPLNTFMSPHGRKLCQGTLYADLRSHAAAMLSLGVDINDVTKLLLGLQAGDRFDEDIRYMFDYEYEDYNEVEYESEEERDYNSEHEYDTKLSVQQRRCDCVFEDDEIDELDHDKEYERDLEDEIEYAMDSHGKEVATAGSFSMRAKAAFQPVQDDKDWRDMPRGKNLLYSDDYDFVEKPVLQVIQVLTENAVSEKLQRIEALVLLRCTASVIRDEQNMIMKKKTEIPKDMVTADNIYEIWCHDSTFEKLVYSNEELAWRLMDEMLMCHGYRRVLIWFITHMEMNHSLIHYIFELIMGFRGESPDSDKNPTTNLPFSRQGPLILSEIETNMLLQEFFTNAAIYFTSRDHRISGGNSTGNFSNDIDDEDKNEDISLYYIGLVKLICFMVNTLIKNSRFDFSKSECLFELQTLLINWIGIIPEAKALFFQLKQTKSQNAEKAIGDYENSTTRDQGLNKNDGFKDKNKSVNDTRTDDDEIIGASNDSSNHNIIQKLSTLLPPGTFRTDAMDTLREFMENYKFEQDIPIFYRKVIKRGSQISSNTAMDRSQLLRDYMKSYEYTSNNDIEQAYTETNVDVNSSKLAPLRHF